jgi:hypothetical protein
MPPATPRSPTASLAKLGAAKSSGPRVAFFGFGAGLGTPSSIGKSEKSEPRSGPSTWRKPDRKG